MKVNLFELLGSVIDKEIEFIKDDSNISIDESAGRIEEDPLELGKIYSFIQDDRKPRLTWNVVYSIGTKK